MQRVAAGWKQLGTKQATHAWIKEGFDSQFIPETSAGSIKIWPGYEECMQGDEYVVKDPKRLKPGKHGTLSEMLKILPPKVLSKAYRGASGHLSLSHAHTLTPKLTITFTLAVQKNKKKRSHEVIPNRQLHVLTVKVCVCVKCVYILHKNRHVCAGVGDSGHQVNHQSLICE